MTDVAMELSDPRGREFRRMLAVSVGLHVGLVLLFTISPGGEVTVPRGVIAVELVAMRAPRAAASRPSPPAPVAPPPPRAPVKEKIVLPKEATIPKPKPDPKPAPARRELRPEDLEKPTPKRDYADVMAQLRAEAGDELLPEPEPVPAGTVAPAGAPSGTGAPIPPEEAAWIRRAKIHVRQNWTLTPGFRTQPLETHVMVQLDASGAVQGEPDIVRKSGNPWYDESVVRALSKASPLPAPPAAGEWAFVFMPEDSF